MCAVYYALAMWTNYISKQHLQRYPYIGCKFCTQQCECVGTKASSLPEEQVFQNEEPFNILTKEIMGIFFS
mgnify:CR=1 FL=1